MKKNLSMPTDKNVEIISRSKTSISLSTNSRMIQAKKTRYDSKNRIVDNYIHHNRFSMDLGAEFMVNHVGIYYKYNPFSVLNTDFGPKFQSMTVGVKLNLYID